MKFSNKTKKYLSAVLLNTIGLQSCTTLQSSSEVPNQPNITNSQQSTKSKITGRLCASVPYDFRSQRNTTRDKSEKCDSVNISISKTTNEISKTKTFKIAELPTTQSSNYEKAKTDIINDKIKYLQLKLVDIKPYLAACKKNYFTIYNAAYEPQNYSKEIFTLETLVTYKVIHHWQPSEKINIRYNTSHKHKYDNTKIEKFEPDTNHPPHPKKRSLNYRIANDASINELRNPVKYSTIARGNYAVQFITQDSQWLAKIDDTIANTFTRTLSLPVFYSLNNNLPTYTVEKLFTIPIEKHKHLIHVILPEKSSNNKGGVYIGQKIGLSGGGFFGALFRVVGPVGAVK